VTSSQAVVVLAAAERLLATLRRVRMLAVVACLAVCTTTSANLPAAMVKPAPDPRFARLDQFFRRYGCPAPQYIAAYLRAADSHGLDYRLLPALSIRETHCGIQEVQNNRWGYHPGRQGFPSIEAGIDYLARQLAENPPYIGKALDDKLFTYNPRPAYPGEIKRLMRQVE
jgi:hypothetical protein